MRCCSFLVCQEMNIQSFLFPSTSFLHLESSVSTYIRVQRLMKVQISWMIRGQNKSTFQNPTRPRLLLLLALSPSLPAQRLPPPLPLGSSLPHLKMPSHTACPIWPSSLEAALIGCCPAAVRVRAPFYRHALHLPELLVSCAAFLRPLASVTARR